MSKTIASAKVIGQRVLNSTTKLINVYAPEIAAEAVPGQFVNVKVCKNTAPLLRRPFGVAGVNKAEGSITMIYRIIGEATHILADVCSGDELSIVGPLGHGFDMSAKNRCWLAAAWAWLRCCFWQRASVRAIPIS